MFSGYDSPGGKIKQGIYSHINSVWSERRLNVLFGYIDEIIETQSQELSENLIRSLYNYMNCIDILTHNLITNL
jgi:hypothetical protein